VTRLLLVDDEGSMLLTLGANLELEGFEVVCAENARKALEILEAHPHFDLVLSDVKMPGMNGVDLYREIRRSYPDLPVLLMTAFAVEELVREAVVEGAFAVLPKPFEIPHAVAALRTAARRPAVLIGEASEGDAAALLPLLHRAGIRAQRARSEREALELLQGDDVDVCVLAPDAWVPGLVARLQTERPEVGCIALSAPNEALTREIAAARPFACVRRPFSAEEVVEMIARARGRRRSAPPR